MGVQNLISLFESKSQDSESGSLLRRTQSMRTVRPKFENCQVYASVDSELVTKEGVGRRLFELRQNLEQVQNETDSGSIALTEIQSKIIRLLFELNLVDDHSAKKDKDELFRDITVLYSHVLKKLKECNENNSDDSTLLPILRNSKPVITRAISTPLLNDEILLVKKNTLQAHRSLEFNEDEYLSKVSLRKKNREFIEEERKRPRTFSVAWTQELGQMPKIKLQPFGMMQAKSVQSQMENEATEDIKCQEVPAVFGIVQRLRNVFEKIDNKPQQKFLDTSNKPKKLITLKAKENTNKKETINNNNTNNTKEANKLINNAEKQSENDAVDENKNSIPNESGNININTSEPQVVQERRVSVSNLKKIFEVKEKSIDEPARAPRPIRSATFSVRSVFSTLKSESEPQNIVNSISDKYIPYQTAINIRNKIKEFENNAKTEEENRSNSIKRYASNEDLISNNVINNVNIDFKRNSVYNKIKEFEETKNAEAEVLNGTRKKRCIIKDENIDAINHTKQNSVDINMTEENNNNCTTQDTNKQNSNNENDNEIKMNITENKPEYEIMTLSGCMDVSVDDVLEEKFEKLAGDENLDDEFDKLFEKELDPNADLQQKVVPSKKVGETQEHNLNEENDVAQLLTAAKAVIENTGKQTKN